jgi:hypothetical protein
MTDKWNLLILDNREKINSGKSKQSHMAFWDTKDKSTICKSTEYMNPRRRKEGLWVLENIGRNNDPYSPHLAKE